jgi:hypothetical protein
MGRGKGGFKKFIFNFGGAGVGVDGWVESGDGYKIYLFFNIFFL